MSELCKGEGVTGGAKGFRAADTNRGPEDVLMSQRVCVCVCEQSVVQGQLVEHHDLDGLDIEFYLNSVQCRYPLMCAVLI